MKFFLLGYKKLIEYKILYIFLMLQVFIFVYTLNISAGLIQYTNYFSSIFNKSALKDCMYFSNSSRFTGSYADRNISVINEKLHQKLKNLNGVKEVLYIKEAFAKIPDRKNSTGIRINIYSKYILENIKFPLLKGKWFYTDISSNEKINNVIISRDLETYFKCDEVYEIAVLGQDKVHDVKIKVIGILGMPGFSFNFRNSGNYLRIDNIFSKACNLMLTDCLVDTNAQKIEGFSVEGKLLIIDNAKNKENIFQKLQKELRDFGDLAQISTMIDLAKKEDKDDLIQQLIIEVLIILLAIAGIGGNNILMLKNSEKEYGIYYMCGMKWSGCISIVAIINFFIVFIPTLAACLIAYYQANYSKHFRMIVNYNNLVISSVLVLFIYLSSCMGIFIKLLKTSPVSIIGRWK